MLSMIQQRSLSVGTHLHENDTSGKLLPTAPNRYGSCGKDVEDYEHEGKPFIVDSKAAKF